MALVLIASYANLYEMKEIVIDSVAALLEALPRAFDHPTMRRDWFRGHSDAAWPLIPSVHRRYSPKDEVDLTATFRLKAPTRHSSCPANGDFARWLCLMQHFGLPTRMLDWTESPVVALFFAITAEPKECPACLWCLSPADLNVISTGRSSVAVLAHDRVSALLQPAFLGGESPDTAVAVLGQDVDLRMTMQQACFTLHGGPTSLEALPNAETFLCKFSIPANARERLRKELWLLGMRRSALFPDIGNLAIELAQEWKLQGTRSRGGAGGA